jgi:cation transport ATPase
VSDETVDEAVEVDLETGEETPVEETTVEPEQLTWSRLWKDFMTLLGFASGGRMELTRENLAIGIRELEVQRRGMRVLFIASMIAIVVIGHWVHPWLGVLILVLYGAYFSAINISGTSNELMRLGSLKSQIDQHFRQAQGDEETKPEHQPGQGQYL